MIKNIYSSSFNVAVSNESKNSLKKTNATPLCNSAPEIPTANYSLNNVLANYMPVSFKGAPSAKHPSLDLDPETLKHYVTEQDEPSDNAVFKTRLRLTDIPEEDMIQGTYYDKLSDDVATILGSKENLILEKEAGVEPDVFMHSFTKKVLHGKYKLLTGHRSAPEIIAIDNPLQFWHEGNMSGNPEMLEEMDKKLTELLKADTSEKKEVARKELAEVKKKSKPLFELIKKSFNSYKDPNVTKILFLDHIEKIPTDYPDYKELLERELPGVLVVGFTDKEKPEEQEEGKVAKGLVKTVTPQKSEGLGLDPKILDGVPKLTISGLSTAEAKHFLAVNPSYTDAILFKFDGNAYLELSKSGRDTLVDLAAENGKDALPKAIREPLSYAASTVLNETKTHIKKGAPFKITANHIRSFYQNHPKVAENFARDKAYNIINESKTRISDLAGLDAAKDEVEDMIDFLKDQKGFLVKGRKTPGGLLFVGPPGTGKSEMASGIAGEVRAKTGKAIPVFYLTDTGNKYINSGQNAVQKIYEELRAHCRKMGVDSGLLVIEEADKVCRKISEDHQEDDKVANELKVQMDSVTTKNSDVKIITIATTNHPEVFDDAFFRPSRFRQVHFGLLETTADIVKLLHIHSKKKPFASEAEKSALLQEIAPTLKGLNGDQMTQVLDEATRLALKANKKIGLKELTDGLFKTLFGPKIHHDYIPEDRRITTLHEWGHAINTPAHERLVAILNESRDIPKVGVANALCFAIEKADIHTTFDTVIGDLASLYGGGEAEKLLNPAHASGVGNDYSKITEMINAAVKKANLGIYTPAISFYTQEGKELEELSKQYRGEIKKDHELFSETAQRISRLRVKSFKDFALNVYLKVQDAAIDANGEGKNYLGNEFNEAVDKWLQESGMVKAKTILEDGVVAIRKVAFNDRFWTQKAKIENARDILSDGIERIIDLSQQKSWLDNATTSAESLTAKIQEIVHLSGNGNKWLSEVGTKNAEQKLIKAVERIVTSASSNKSAASSLKQAASLLFSFV